MSREHVAASKIWTLSIIKSSLTAHAQQAPSDPWLKREGLIYHWHINYNLSNGLESINCLVDRTSVCSFEQDDQHATVGEHQVSIKMNNLDPIFCSCYHYNRCNLNIWYYYWSKHVIFLRHSKVFRRHTPIDPSMDEQLMVLYQLQD